MQHPRSLVGALRHWGERATAVRAIADAGVSAALLLHTAVLAIPALHRPVDAVAVSRVAAVEQQNVTAQQVRPFTTLADVAFHLLSLPMHDSPVQLIGECLPATKATAGESS